MTERIIKCKSCGAENPTYMENCLECGKPLPKVTEKAVHDKKPVKPAVEADDLDALRSSFTDDPNNEPGKIDLKWLWISLGALAILGAIVTIVFLLVNKQNPKGTESSEVAPATASNTDIVIKTKTSTVDKMEMVYVPAGEFIMGAEDDTGNANEHPQHTVYLDAYWIDMTEVTNAQYEKCVVAGACTDPKNETSNTLKKYYGNDNHSQNPVIYVTWDQAKAYCEWAGRVLPTEAQWEKAARGTDGLFYPWGDEDPEYSFVNYNGKPGDTVPVGSYPDGASPYGALDMAGNVWEWVADYYGDQYYDISPLENPTGPESGKYHILRGGSWYNLKADIRTTIRSAVSADKAYYDTGFRCVLNP